MARTAGWRWIASLGAGILAALAFTGGADAQNFRVTYDIDRNSRPDQVKVTGSVYNAGPGECFDVTVTAEALASTGKVVASGVTYIDSRIGRGESKPFVALVPTVATATRYRVAVTSFRAGFSSQAP
jgi:hypothetical protein